MKTDKVYLGRRVAELLFVWAAISACVGCGDPSDNEFHPVWPLPPAPPRVAHLKNVAKPTDLAKPNFFQQLARLIAGESKFRLMRPNSVAVVEGKRLYVTDQEQQALLVFDLKSPKAVMISKAGDTFLVSPVGVAACGDLVAVADSALNAVFVLTPKGKLVKTVTKPGGFKRPTGLAYDAGNGLLYVTDTLANEICAFALATGKLVRRFGSHGTGKGQFNFPTHIFLDGTGKIYVTDSLNFRVQAFDSQGKYLFHVGKLGDASGHLGVPKGVAVDTEGHIYIVDSYFGTVQVFDQKGRFLLTIGRPGTKSGAFQVPTGITIDSSNKIYVCDSYNNRVQILQYVGGRSDESNESSP